MPLEIRELYIKVAVNDDTQEQTADTSADTSGGNGQESLIQACVERVLEILKEREDR